MRHLAFVPLEAALSECEGEGLPRRQRNGVGADTVPVRCDRSAAALGGVQEPGYLFNDEATASPPGQQANCTERYPRTHRT